MNVTTKPLIAFHGEQAEKDAILKQLQAHYDADEIIHGLYWEKGKGCAVGCTIHSGRHELYEPRFGIPQALAQLEDAIFEGMGNGDSKQWPLRFMRAIRPGADLSHVQWQFLHRILTDESINLGINHPIVKQAVSDVAALVAGWAKGDPIDVEVARSAAESARSAAESARSAWSAWSAAWSAWSAAESAAWSAAESAAWSARSAAESARSAWSAAWSAAESARSAWSAAESARSAWSAAYVKMADVLIELLEAA